MKLHELVKLTHRKERVGRGIAAGQGKTAGRGTKGQKARTGKGAPTGFEGGQTRLYRRLPKKSGFQSIRPQYATITLSMLDRMFVDKARIDLKALHAAGLIRAGELARIVKSGMLTRRGLRIAGDVRVTKGAQESIDQVK